MSERPPRYTRPLPGGGYVEIDESGDAEAGFCARLRVERRADPQRREGHPPPVIAESEGADPEVAFAPLHAIAASNVFVAQRIQRWQMRNR